MYDFLFFGLLDGLVGELVNKATSLPSSWGSGGVHLYIERSTDGKGL